MSDQKYEGLSGMGYRGMEDRGKVPLGGKRDV